ncbi:MAG: hypothetical protein IPM18_12870 [Phycisphaerales bacterium]|nr:hypothetical protein [Phycisphaerales bacterium]
MGTLMWFVGFALMMGSFAFLFGRNEEPHEARISVEPWWPDGDSRTRRN